MASLSDVASDERTARMVLSMLVEPNDPVTGRILSRLGAVETLWLAERDGAVVGLSPVDAQVWRDHLSVPDAKELAARIDQVQQSGVRALIPGDSDYGPSADAAVRTQRTRCGTIGPRPGRRGGVDRSALLGWARCRRLSVAVRRAGRDGQSARHRSRRRAICRACPHRRGASGVRRQLAPAEHHARGRRLCP